jgi:hypothetical protein
MISLFVMAGLRPGHPRLSFSSLAKDVRMPGTRPGMTFATFCPDRPVDNFGCHRHVTKPG